MMSNEIVLKMEGIGKTFPGVVALDNVHLELRRGEVHVLLGENGAGKSTLMKILSGAYKKDAGRVVLDGREVEIKNPRHAQALGIGVIYQEFNLIPHLSAGENIYLGREPERFPGVLDQEKMFARAQRWLDDLGAGVNARTAVSRLRVAQQQMVEVAKALSLDAQILIMDEPTSALTEREIRELFAAIRRLKEKGVAIVYISHRLDEIFEIGDRVTVLLDGRHAGTYAVPEMTKPRLIRLMVNRELQEQFPKVKVARGEEVLRVEQLSRAGVLKDIRFSLHRGEVLGIAGLVGSGRTELARAIFGLDGITAGNIYVRGRRGRITSPRRAIRRGLGFLTEDRKAQGLVLKLSVKENISLPVLDKLGRLGLLNRKEETRLAARYVDELRIKTPALDQKVLLLSGGNQQKVVLSKWLGCQADILIFDEPTRGIDVGAKVEIYQWMNRLTAAGAAVMMISSELPEILGMSDRILVMREGSISGEFTADEATPEKILRCALGH